MLTPMLSVHDVPATSTWLQTLFGLTSVHGGPDFEMLAGSSGRVVLWLHAQDADHEHGDLLAGELTTVGQGVIFYIQVVDLVAARERASDLGATIVEELHVNLLAGFSEFTVTGSHGFRFAAHSKSSYGR
ncbi:MAG: putative enzyme related to lactoylglutathione lyase [Kiritimatiellia bacterium]|jgi:predicted enzyme related to lactoylglutathione lyase